MRTSISNILQALKEVEYKLQQHDIQNLEELIFEDSALDSMFEFSNETSDQLASVIQFLLIALE